MVIFEELYKELKNLRNAGEFTKAHELIDTEMKSELDIESKSRLLSMKGKALNMIAFNMADGIKLTAGPPPEYSDDYKLLNEAITCFDKSIELKPDNEFAYENKGMSLANKGDFKEAIKCGNAALEINPTNFQVLANISLWYKEIKKFEESVTCADKVIQNKNMASKNELITSYVNKSVSQFNLKQRDCIHSMESAIELVSDPKDKESLLETLQKMKKNLI